MDFEWQRFNIINMYCINLDSSSAFNVFTCTICAILYYSAGLIHNVAFKLFLPLAVLF